VHVQLRDRKLPVNVRLAAIVETEVPNFGCVQHTGLHGEYKSAWKSKAASQEHGRRVTQRQITSFSGRLLTQTCLVAKALSSAPAKKYTIACCQYLQVRLLFFSETILFASICLTSGAAFGLAVLWRRAIGCVGCPPIHENHTSRRAFCPPAPVCNTFTPIEKHNIILQRAI
jgi:hypothetical protein